ncbi:MarR family winged helix-turn-helix transcriptional regulator [Pseudoroseomonas cervicalis]|uniref:MarR family winged helix-turn-helix transcriptional regulator n=1 Tax=Teichococcus cervicalis TaxID=204525 RepID=UPI0022F19826|nr:MarR family winged helix-turn-helix transcriptional regulator [Pseudoroseomonas cervicalis]WBV42921.1 MarR family winged helix-turn-helix transcriptional regulator [Pseudoroseomonas cervicalis]
MDRPALPDLHRRFGGHFIAVTRAWRREADLRLAPLGLSHATALALLLLRDHAGEGCRQGRLAAVLGIEQPSLVPLLDHLAGAGLVERRPDPADRRARTLHVTREGGRIAEAAGAALDTLRAELLGDSDPDDIAAALRVLEAMAAKLGCPPGGFA